MGASVHRRIAVGKGREARRALVQAKEQWRVALHKRPDQLSLLVDRRRPVFPHQLASLRLGSQFIDCVHLGTQMVGAVEPFARKEGIRRQGFVSC